MMWHKQNHKLFDMDTYHWIQGHSIATGRHLALLIERGRRTGHREIDAKTAGVYDGGRIHLNEHLAAWGCDCGGHLEAGEGADFGAWGVGAIVDLLVGSGIVNIKDSIVFD